MAKHKKQQRLKPYKTMKLAEKNSWKAPDGYKVLVLDRGAVMLNIPRDWLLVNLEPHVTVHDQQPPDDNARLSVSFWRHPPHVDWTGLPLPELLEKSVGGDKLKGTDYTPVARLPRTDIEIVWTEHRFRDDEQDRWAFSRVTVARGFGVHAVLSFDYWVDEAEQFLPVWDEIVRSLQLGLVIDDPTKGVTLH